MSTETESNPPTQTELTETLNRLTELTDQARIRADRADRARQPRIAVQARHLALQLDGLRTGLITRKDVAPERGDLNSERAYIVAASIELQGITTQLDAETGYTRTVIEHVEAGDILEWLDWHAIHLYPYQRRSIERAA